MWRILLDMDVAENKGDNLLLVAALQIVPRNRKSTKAKKDSGENGNVRGKSCHDCTQCLVFDIAILFCLYNHSQQLEGRADGQVPTQGTPFRREETTIKREGKETEGRG